MTKWILVLAAAAATAWAQGRVVGTVTTVDAATRQISLKTTEGDIYAIQVLPEGTVRKIAPGETDLTKAAAMELAGVIPGDRVMARGKQDTEAKTLLAAQLIVIPRAALDSRDADRQRQWRMNSVAGVVKSVNPLQVQARGDMVWTVETAGVKSVHRYADDAAGFARALPAAVADIQPGDQVRVLGSRDMAAKKVEGTEVVFGRYRTLGGEIKSVQADARKVVLFDLTTKKNITIAISGEARMTRAPGGPGGVAPGAGARGFRPTGPRAEGAGGPEPGGRPAGGPGPGRQGPGGPMPAGDRPQGPGGRMMGGPDPSMLLERLPPISISDLRAGDAVLLTVGRPDSDTPVALSLVAGLDFLLRAPAQQATQMIANWNMDGGLQ